MADKHDNGAGGPTGPQLVLTRAGTDALRLWMKLGTQHIDAVISYGDARLFGQALLRAGTPERTATRKAPDDT